MADEFGSKDIKPAYDKMRSLTIQDCIKEAQTIYDLRGKPPYNAYDPLMPHNISQEELNVLSDFVAHWLPYLKLKGKE